ncbi:MAG: YggS family pyridoxal phosphate-dependent enzyme [Clostridia bacterium]|nr:YggS family pyridoxal phosphate-dependent enzyme [Clostridia bacterium]
MLERDVLIGRVREYREKLYEASGRWGGVKICAVTKTMDADTANLAYEAGIDLIGENRVQELMEKLPALNPNYEIHLIGQLQTNKVKYLMGHADMIQSLNRDSLAQEIHRQAVKAGLVMPVLVQVNIAREPQKGGIDEEELLPFLRRTAELNGLRVKGLMAIMPQADDPESVRPYFKRMRDLFERLRDQAIPGIEMTELSMGMSHDCLVAAQEGATMVRLGSALFGKRDYSTAK